MRVAYLTWGYPSPAAPYAGSFFRNQVEALSELGLDLQVVAPVPWVPRAMGCVSPTLQRYSRTPRASVSGSSRAIWPRYFVPFPRLWQFGLLHRFLKPVVEHTFAERPDVVHVHSGSTLGYATADVARRYHIPFVLTLHGSDVNVYPNLSARHREHFYQAVTGASRVFAVSEALAKRTEALSGIRPQVLPIGVDVRRFSAATKNDKRLLRVRLGLPLEKKILLYAGNLTVAKGVADLVKAVEALPHEDVHCVFVGDGVLRGQVSKLASCTVVGQVPNHRVPEYMAAADVLVHPSHREGMPTVAVEAGMMGLPVVATDVGGIPELLREGRGMLVPAADPRTLKEVIEFSVSHPEVLTSMAGKLREHVRRNHDAAENARRLRDVYRKVVGSPARRRATA